MSALTVWYFCYIEIQFASLCGTLVLGAHVVQVGSLSKYGGAMHIFGENWILYISESGLSCNQLFNIKSWWKAGLFGAYLELASTASSL